MKMIRIITTLLFIVFRPLTVCGQKNPYWQEPTAAEAESNSLADGNPYIGPMPVEGRPDDHLYTESDEPHLNNEPVQDDPRFVYSGKNAELDLGIAYKPASVSFADYAAGNKNSKP